MKKTVLNSMIVMLITLISCQNEELVQKEEPNNIYTLNVELSSESRTQVNQRGNTTWSKGDQLLVYGENVESVLTLPGADARLQRGLLPGRV